MVTYIESRAKEFGYTFAGYIRFLLAKEVESEISRKDVLNATRLSDIQKAGPRVLDNDTKAFVSKNEIKDYFKVIMQEEGFLFDEETIEAIKEGKKEYQEGKTVTLRNPAEIRKDFEQMLADGD